MAPPVPVELKPHDPLWADAARAEAARLETALGDALVAVHHVGSTAIPGIIAKPTLDLIPVARDLAALDAAQPEIEALGYEWWGEFGLAGRRFCTLDDKATGKRRVHLHCYAEGDAAITRYVAFRDFLKSRPDLIAEYEALKLRCRDAHGDSSHAYSVCKGDWVRRIEAEALARLG